MRVVKTAEDRKNEILDVAEQFFAVKGFEETSTNDIIQAIGIARGTLYHHFRSKEEILDCVIERISQAMVKNAKLLAADGSIPLLERLTGTVCSLQADSRVQEEVMTQMHKPQNALLHQKMQERMIESLVPVFAGLIEEGIRQGLLSTRYPAEAAQMIIVYSHIAFDELWVSSPEEEQKRRQAFIYHTERILGAREGLLQEPLGKVFQNQDRQRKAKSANLHP